MMTQQDPNAKLEEYRGAKKWEGLIPAEEGPREMDEGFRAFLLKYGMINQVVYDVFRKDEDNVVGEDGLSGRCIYEDNKDFTEKGLKFSYIIHKDQKQKLEYDFTNEYHVVGNMVCSPRSFSTAEDSWFGFILLSNDLSELVVVFRGTETTKEWIENFTINMEQLEGEPEEPCLAKIFNRKDLMVHVGFQSLYTQKPVRGGESPKETVHRLVKEHKSTLDKVTVVGHSLGAALAQICAVDLAHSKVAGEIPILGISWASPKIGNPRLADWVDKMHPSLRILRIRGSNDQVTTFPPDWLWWVFNGGYKHLGTEMLLSNEYLIAQGLVKDDGGNSPNHNLEMYLHNIDPSRDVALMNKKGNVIPVKYCDKNRISPTWHNVSWPRTIYDK